MRGNCCSCCSCCSSSLNFFVASFSNHWSISGIMKCVEVFVHWLEGSQAHNLKLQNKCRDLGGKNFCSNFLYFSCSSTWLIHSGAGKTTYIEKTFSPGIPSSFSRPLSVPWIFISRLHGVPHRLFRLPLASPASPAPPATNPRTPIFLTKSITTYRSPATPPILPNPIHRALANDDPFPATSISSSAGYSGFLVPVSPICPPRFRPPLF